MEPANLRSRRVRLSPLSLELFVAVIEEGSIASVAETHNLASSAISKRLSDLEATLGAALIRRTNRGIEPSAAGVVLARLARSVLSDLDDIHFRIQEYSEGVRGRVRLIANRSSSIGYLPGELKVFAARHPHIHVSLQEAPSVAVIRSVVESEADIGLFWLPEPTAGLEILPYHVDDFVVIVPNAHPLASRPALRLSEILDHEFVGLHDDAVRQLRDAAAALGKLLKVRIQVSSFDAMFGMVCAGLGIAVLPKSCVPPQAIGSLLSVIRLDEPWSRRELKIGVRSYDSLTAASKLLYNHLARRADMPEKSTN